MRHIAEELRLRGKAGQFMATASKAALGRSYARLNVFVIGSLRPSHDHYAHAELEKRMSVYV